MSGRAAARQTGVALLGSTGSIGEQALDVIRDADGRFRVVALAARRSAARLAAQAREFRPATVVLVEKAEAAELARDLPPGCRLEVGPEAVAELACADGAEVVLNGITGSVGLLPTLRALDADRRLALANKESLIVGGPLVASRARSGQIVPVDSEHSALAQCLRAGTHEEVGKLVVTASGGPFRGRSAAELADVTPEEALAHPTWSMGPVITINSATLMNKGLEVIEAHAANEEAVAAFRAGRLRFPAIAEVVRQVLVEHRAPERLDLDAVLAAEQWSRERARTLVENLNPTGETA